MKKDFSYTVLIDFFFCQEKKIALNETYFVLLFHSLAAHVSLLCMHCTYFMYVVYGIRFQIDVFVCCAIIFILCIPEHLSDDYISKNKCVFFPLANQ